MPLPIKLSDRPLSYSSLSAFQRSPSNYIEYLTMPRMKSDAFLLGDAVDCLLLTPDDFEKRFAVSPKFNKATTVGKEGAAKFAKEAANKTVIDEAMYAKALRMVNNFKNNAHTNAFLCKLTQTQREIKFTDKETGLPLIAKLDGTGENLICDLKTTQNASPEEFSRSVFNYGYHLQAAIYSEGMKSIGQHCDFYWLCVESSAPYGCSVIKAHKDVLAYGKQELRKLLDMFRYCLDNDLWKSSYDFWTGTGVSEISLPGWLKNKLEK